MMTDNDKNRFRGPPARDEWLRSGITVADLVALLATMPRDKVVTFRDREDGECLVIDARETVDTVELS